MTGKLLPVLLSLLLMLTACTAHRGPDGVVPGDETKQTEEPASETPGPGEEPGEDTPDTDRGQTGTGEEPVRWYPRGIGMPLATDDPAHQDDKVVMLTFDDGPSQTDSTARILDVLKAEGVRAVFFVTGYGAKHTDMLRRIAEEGHVIGLHTVTHSDLTTLTPEEIRAELVPLMETIETVTGQRPRYLRPPFGAYNDQVLAVAAELGLEVVTWTSGSLDWEGTDASGYKDPAVVVADVMSQLYPGAVYLFHDTLLHTAEALPTIIQRMQAEGYEFVVLP
ncbi:MAG TPA: polysaccharide deacetylase family protein [Symbiobacteriaceae bacterium]